MKDPVVAGQQNKGEWFIPRVNLISLGEGVGLLRTLRHQMSAAPYSTESSQYKEYTVLILTPKCTLDKS